MLKWFRKYNKMMLVVMGSLLMVTFLVQPALDMFSPSQGDQVIGQIDGKDLKLAEQQQAASDLVILQSLSPLLAQTSSGPLDPLQWLLMKREAASLDLSASKLEARQLISLLGVDERGQDRLAQQMDVTRDQIVEVVRDWLAVQQYRELVLGLGHLPLEDRLQQVALASQMLQFGYVPGAVMALQSSRGRPRVSEPLVQRFMHDQQASVKVVVLPLEATRYLQQTPDPDPSTLQQLFDQYKDNLPGTSKPYGFGYKFPDRVKLEFLTLPADRLQAMVEVSETQALAYYDANLDQFRKPGADGKPGEPQPYTDVRDLIVRQLRSQSAEQLGERVARATAALLNEEGRAAKPKADPAAAVAQRIQQQFGILPEVRRLDQQWLDARTLSGVPGLGSSMTVGRNRVPFALYALAAEPLHEAAQKLVPEGERQPADPMAGLHLKVAEPSIPLSGDDGAFYIFRVLEAQPTHVPAALDEVRERVAIDARRLSAYRMLLDEKAMWLGRARNESLQTLAQSLNVQLLTPTDFSRRQFGFQGTLEVPDVPPIGRSEQFVDGVFDLVDQLGQEIDLAIAAEGQRTGAVAVDEQQTLYLVRVDKFTPMTKEEFERVAAGPQVPSFINDLVVPQPVQDPLSVDAIAKRIGYTRAGGGEPEPEPGASAN